MKNNTQQLQAELDQTVRLLEHRAFFSFTEEERQSIESKAKDFLDKLATIEDSTITIGLLGGTGVGKSTLMNALAGTEIASASHRRPHTDHVLIYRHEKIRPIPALPLTGVPWREVTHTSDEIQSIILCDLPDYDSLMGEHLKIVLNFLDHLDILVWVTSPEKYADGQFYDFLKMVPKAKQNFYFVLNKTDRLFGGENFQEGYGRLERVVSSLQEHIRESGIGEPLVFTLSAKDTMAFGATKPWNRFHGFRKQIFQQRDIKKIKVIKAANLDVEIRRFLGAFKKELDNLTGFEQVLDLSVAELEENRDRWIKEGSEDIDLWLGKHIRQDMFTRQINPSVLMGAGYAIALFFEKWQHGFIPEHNTLSNSSLYTPPDDTAVPFLRRLELIEERFAKRIVHQNLPPAFQKEVKRILNISNAFDDLKQCFAHTVAWFAVNPPKPSFRGFRMIQRITYTLLLAFLVFALGDQAAWRHTFASPGLNGIFGVILSVIQTLFSAKGAAALVSFTLLYFFFAFYFFRRYGSFLKRHVQTVTVSLKLALNKIWEEKLNGILDDLKGLKAEIRSRKTTLSNLMEE